MKKEDGQIPKIPTKHDDSVTPIVTQLDVLRHPVFLAAELSDEDFDSEILISGKNTKVVRTGPKAGMNEEDLFHALVHVAYEGGFETQDVEFVSRRLLKLMKWGVSGAEYRRLIKAMNNLCAMRVTIDSDVVWKQMQFFHSPEIWHNAKDPDQEPLFKSSVSMGKALFKLCKSGRLKRVHSYYYDLRRFKYAKKIFSQICGRASDLKFWKVDIFELAKLIGLSGKKYKTVYFLAIV